MNHRVARLFAAAFVIAAGVPARISAESPRYSAGNVEILVNGAPVPHYAHNGRWYVEALKGREYAIRLRNPYPVRVAVALSVDGLNTIDARETTATDARKWVLEPHATVTISGWQTSQTEARRFEFTTEARSYGQALGKTANLGTISAVFFRERVTAVSRDTNEQTDRRTNAPRSAGAGCRRGACCLSAEVEGRRRVRRHRHGSSDRPRRHARVAGPRGRSSAHGEHPLRVPPAAREAWHSAARCRGRPTDTSRACAGLRAGLQPRTAEKVMRLDGLSIVELPGREVMRSGTRRPASHCERPT